MVYFIYKLILIINLIKNISSLNLRNKIYETDNNLINLSNLTNLTNNKTKQLDLPKQIHISQGLEPTTIFISWITTKKIKTQLNYQLDDYIAQTNISTQYGYSNLFQLNDSLGYIHYIKLENLLSDSLYNFECGDFELNITLNSNFRTIPIKGPQTKSTTFGLIGDTIKIDMLNSVINELSTNERIRMIIHTGELSFRKKEFGWYLYGEIIEPISNHIPWFITPQNLNYNNKLNNDSNFEIRYQLPFLKDNEYENSSIETNRFCQNTIQSDNYYGGGLFYSFNNGIVHMVFLNSNLSLNSFQYKWFIKDMENIDRKTTPWIIITVQNQIYTQNLTEIYDNLFFKYKVNLVLTSNSDYYKRTVIYQDNKENNIKMYLDISKWYIYFNKIDYTDGYGTLTIINSYELEWKWFVQIDNKFSLYDKIIISNLYFNKKYLRGTRN